jgi:hypothetical protein
VDNSEIRKFFAKKQRHYEKITIFAAMKQKAWLATAFIVAAAHLSAQHPLDWGDQLNGTYKNPVLNADFSDPDVIRVDDKYYMVASDFHFLGMQVLRVG